MERKLKYNYEFKLRCVEKVLKYGHSIASVATADGFDASNLRKWIGFYRKYGADGLLSRKNQVYTAEFKAMVLQAIDKELLSLRQACVEFDIPSDSILIQWQRTYARYGPAGLFNKPKGRPVMDFKRAKKKSGKPLTREEELLKENEALRAENALLKKFNALVQAKELQQQKKLKP